MNQVLFTLFKTPITVLTLIVACILIGMLVTLFSKKVQEILSDGALNSPLFTFAIPGWLACLYAIHLRNSTGSLHGFQIIKVIVYLFLPTLLLYNCWWLPERLTWRDACAFAALWLPIDYRWLRLTPTPGVKTPDYFILVISATILLAILLVCCRKLEDVKLVFAGRWKDVRLVFIFIGALIAILLPLGISVLGFLHPKPNYANVSTNFPVSVVKFSGIILLVSLVTALPEELLFRGYLQNILEKTFARKTAPIIPPGVLAVLVASLIFGVAHLDNGATSIWPSGWNWRYGCMATVAGMAYGTVFRKTPSILFPVFLHAFVDATWGMFFVK